MQEAELKNQFFFDSMLKHAGLPHSQDVVPSSNKNNASGSEKVNITNDRSKGVAWSSDQTIDKVHSVLKSLARDWSKEAAAERAMSYAPILDGLKRHVPLSDKMPTRILVPGYVLTSLVYECFVCLLAISLLLYLIYFLKIIRAGVGKYFCLHFLK